MNEARRRALATFSWLIGPVLLVLAVAVLLQLKREPAVGNAVPQTPDTTGNGRLEWEGLPGFGEYIYCEELPEVLIRVEPVYPDIAREAGVDGTVMVWALVGRDGRVKHVRLGQSIPLLDDAATAAVGQWLFKPARASGNPIAMWVVVPVKFALR